MTSTATRLPVFARLSGGMQTPLPARTTVKDALVQRGLADWDVQTMPLVTLGHDGQPLDTGKVSTVRRTHDGGSKVLGVGLATGYPVIQNEVALGVDSLLSESGAEVEFAGAWKDDRQTFLSMRLPESVLIGGEDRTDLYLTALTSHDGSAAATIMVSPVRFACTNVLTLTRLHAVATYKVRHVGDAGLKVAEARAALNMTFAYADEWKTAMTALTEREMTDAMFDAMIKKEFVTVGDDVTGPKRDRAETARADLRHLFRESETTAFGRGTRYAAFQAITEWSEWVRPRDAFTEGAAASTLAGAGATLRDRAFATLTR